MKINRTTNGMSLLIVLAFIVIISVLVVGFSESMRLLRPTAASHLERARADQFAWSGIERVIATLNQQTANTNSNWISQPGQLVTGSVGTVLTNIVPLHSGGAVTNADPILAPPNLNVVTYRDPTTHLITEKPDATGTNAISMQVGWIYVRQSGALDTNSSPTVSNNDPVVGRYAYWADDESSKVNYNVAWGRSGNTNAPGHPTRIELSALTNFSQSYADTVHNFVTRTNSANTPYNFFNTPLDARRIEKVSGGTGVSAALKDNKFDVTHYNNDPNTTFFNEPRIVLTTRPDRAGWTYKGGQWVGVNGLPWPNGRPYYLRCLANEGTTVQPNVIPAQKSNLDPGWIYSIDLTKITSTLTMLAWAQPPNPSYLQRSDWPVVTGPASFQDKYYPASIYSSTVCANGIGLRSSRTAQIAINIFDYVRAKESPLPIIAPIRGIFKSGNPANNCFSVFSDAPTDSYMGVSRTPYLTEIGVWLGTAAVDAATPTGSTNYTPPKSGDTVYEFKFEVYLPKSYGIASYDLSQLAILFAYSGVTGGYSYWTLSNSDGTTSASPKVLNAGSYAIITHQEKVPAGITLAGAGRPTTLANVRVALRDGNNQIFDLVPVVLTGVTNLITLPIDSFGVSDTAITSLEVDDPRVNKQKGNWMQNTTGNTFGGQNNALTVGKSPSLVKPPLATGSPQYDTDSSGNISDASFYMPPPAGQTFIRSDGTVDDNSAGMVASAGELGFIHTGIEAATQVSTNNGSGTIINAPPGTPWRTLRLQPNSYPNTSVVPDWALIDLFTAPVAAPNQYNKYVYAPHDTAFGGRVNLNSQAVPFGIPRTVPLAAVLQNNTYDSTDTTKKVGAASAQTLANNIYNQTLATTSPLGKQYGYAAGYDSPGEIAEIKGVADGGEKSEELVRQVMNLVTARGNTFSVYTIGQAIKQKPNGDLTVTAQQRSQAMVERWQDAITSEVHFSPVYFRNLSP